MLSGISVSCFAVHDGPTRESRPMPSRSLPLSVLQQIDQLCDSFEEAWQGGLQAADRGLSRADRRSRSDRALQGAPGAGSRAPQEGRRPSRARRLPRPVRQLRRPGQHRVQRPPARRGYGPAADLGHPGRVDGRGRGRGSQHDAGHDGVGQAHLGPRPRSPVRTDRRSGADRPLPTHAAARAGELPRLPGTRRGARARRGDQDRPTGRLVQPQAAHVAGGGGPPAGEPRPSGHRQGPRVRPADGRSGHRGGSRIPVSSCWSASTARRSSRFSARTGPRPGRWPRSWPGSPTRSTMPTSRA